MSYEGREQIICKNGHYSILQSLYDASIPTCPICKEDPVWVNSVDDTNCDAIGFIPDEEMNKFLIQEAKTCTCACGHVHPAIIGGVNIYRIPTKEETKATR